MPLQATNPAAGFVGSDLAPPCLEWDRIYFLYRAVFPPRVLLLLAGAPIMLHQPQRAHSSTRSSYCLSHVRHIDRLRRAHCGKGAFLAFLPGWHIFPSSASYSTTQRESERTTAREQGVNSFHVIITCYFIALLRRLDFLPHRPMCMLGRG